MFNFLILSSVWNTRFRVISDHTDYPRELKLISTERIMRYHNVTRLSISVKPKNTKETTLVLRVCVYMTARSWTNVWHTTWTKYTQMSVLQWGDCFEYSYFSCAETLFANILIAITRNLSVNRSQTPISSYKMHNPREGVRLKHTP